MRIWIVRASFQVTVRHALVHVLLVLRIQHMGFRVAARCLYEQVRDVAHLGFQPVNDLPPKVKHITFE
jgi:hypothetical protein